MGKLQLPFRSAMLVFPGSRSPELLLGAREGRGLLQTRGMAHVFEPGAV